jgi:hypothetical protein
MTKPYVITFAGVPGSSKSIIAFSLSMTFSLPIFSTDNIRYEVKEDLLVENINVPAALKEFHLRQQTRFQNILDTKKNFIRDGSVDRRWQEIKDQLDGAGYTYCLIDMELSKDFMINLYRKTGRTWAIEELDAYMAQHIAFMENYSDDITIKITDQLFKKRSEVAEIAVQKFQEKF